MERNSSVQSSRQSSVHRSMDERTSLLHASQRSIQCSYQNNVSLSDDEPDFLHVEIPAISEEDSRLFHSTSIALHTCEKTVLKPYLILLALLGWRPLVDATSVPRRILNLIYLLSIVGCIVASYVVKVIVCERDNDFAAPTISPLDDDSVDGDVRITETPLFNGTPTYSHCPHILTLFIVPESIHFLAYVYLFYHYRIRETEQLSALIETVFLQTTGSQSSVTSAAQRRLTLTLRMFLVSGLAWLTFTVATELVQFVHVRQSHTSWESHLDVWVLEVVGHLIINAVFVAIAINYCTQCQLLICFVRAVLLSIAERSLDLKAVMKNIYGLKQFVSRLNSQIATAASMCMFVYAELLIIGFSELIQLKRSRSPLVWVHRSMVSVQWLLVLSAVIIQAFRLTELLVKLRYSGLSVRVFGYRTSPQLDLDSFLDFVTNTKMQAKLFAFPVRLRYIIGLVVVVSFVFLILLQLSSSVAESVNI